MSKTARIVVVQAGRPPEDFDRRLGEQADWFRHALDHSAEEISVVRPFVGDDLPKRGSFGAAIITGSWSMVTELADWSERTAAWIRDVVTSEARILGVCFGHQLMAHALGGRVDYHPRGSELGRKEIRLTPAAAADPLLGGLPGNFEVFLAHQQSVLDLPAGAAVLAGSEHDPHQIIRYRPNALSTQFHPEFTPALMRACMDRELAATGDDQRPQDHEPLTIPRQLLNAFCLAKVA